MKKVNQILYLITVLLLPLYSCQKVSTSDQTQEQNNRTLNSKKQPNIVIVFLDDSGYSDFSPFGQSKMVTPNVEKLLRPPLYATCSYLLQS